MLILFDFSKNSKTLKYSVQFYGGNQNKILKSKKCYVENRVIHAHIF